MNMRVLGGDLHTTQLRTRMPFKYGIATMTEMPMVFVRLAVEIGRTQSVGVAADLLPPKWFTKDPARQLDEEITEMLRAAERAVAFANGMSAETPFDLWRMLYAAQARWAEQEKLAPLLAHFGTSLVERAVIEAACRAAGRPFTQLLRENVFGIRLGELHEELRGVEPADVLPLSPLAHIIARHTVGLSDPLHDADIAPAERVNDGLPQSLAACILHYGLRHFKIKVNGDLERDLARLHRVAEVIQQNVAGDFAFTLDGNEQFKSFAEFRVFWEAVTASEKLKEFLRRLLFVEQPVHRAEALKPEAGAALRAWPERPPFIIDESDGEIGSLPTALALGYNGTSHKNCKGVFKGVSNRCLLLRRAARGARCIMSGEDLCNVGPVALLQDLAVCAALGIESVERNGHHYNAGLSQFPKPVQEQVLKMHGDLYHRSDAGWPTLTIRNGNISLNSVNGSPFGVRFLVDVAQFTK
ncbi:MAG: hypothetical protein HY300_08795, partial [Verrucomicrobia bacterium]|nr:hypothetical protein [Verrucomicrobiota bacterium]